jgi:hypothetical protein
MQLKLYLAQDVARYIDMHTLPGNIEVVIGIPEFTK